MSHIELGVDETLFPGISGPMLFRPQTAAPMSDLVEVLLRGENTLSRGERELIAAYVSSKNDCEFCTDSHSAFAAAQLDEGMPLVLRVRADPDEAPITPKLAALLRIAGAVAKSGREVTTELVGTARAQGATDEEIHDTVLIAAAFCMYNRYVDGLGTLPAGRAEDYQAAAEAVVANGYLPLAGRAPSALNVAAS
ncbi:Carboxymuconolactone decarboxylase [Catenulispora acidiphila DSM 44928]|uniref:Carboxymuconolactone decarboxylase n=1 Tax=Catenulispora acidiphila (strain DSM 44928 / JCM 14897 / NBRC 102108 / NRRL B-24433 / ID139908) TaxID=479433 RepID=C7PWF7_CATAD|nr:carboxymuconolactone decarboxylase family protein [Catenulispora acidiphila]ACU75237.1 Carboxymuconolactone decarboxylase [Catenulispora acidiphila DSM 44928]